MSSAEKPICFVISPIGDPGSETRKRADKVLTHVFEVAFSDEYEVRRADKISQPGMITTQILRALQDSELVIADLTEHNPNVFYELAVRHAVEKPVIHVTDPRWKIPFDVAGFRTIVFDFTDLDSVAEAIKQLKKQARDVAHSSSWGETPIKLANIMRRSKEDSKETVLLKEAVQGISRLQTDVSELTSIVRSQFVQLEKARQQTAAYGSVRAPDAFYGRGTGDSESSASRNNLLDRLSAERPSKKSDK